MVDREECVGIIRVDRCGLPWFSLKFNSGLETRMGGTRTKHMYVFQMARVVSGVFFVLKSLIKALVDTFANILVIL